MLDIPRGTLFPVLPRRDIVVFPHMIVPLFVGRDIWRVVPIPGLTGSPSPLIVLAIVECLGPFERSARHAAASMVDGRGAR